MLLFHVVLRGGPSLIDDESARLVDETDPDAVIVRAAVDGTTARFRISGEYELVEGRQRRVYLYEAED